MSRLEPEWSIIHRERSKDPEAELVGALTVLQAALYHCPESAFSADAEARAEAKLLRDTRADAGGITAEDWSASIRCSTIPGDPCRLR